MDIKQIISETLNNSGKLNRADANKYVKLNANRQGEVIKNPDGSTAQLGYGHVLDKHGTKFLFIDGGGTVRIQIINSDNTLNTFKLESDEIKVLSKLVK